MTNSNRRIALLTGASLAALGLATPSFAAPHDVLLPGGDQTNPGTNTSDPLIDLCTIAAATSECFYGVIDTGTATAFATVSSTGTGRIEQTDVAATVDLVATVAALETAEIGAIAVASNPAGAAVAFASITNDGFRQHATATTGDASVLLDVDGRLLIDALASAVATAAATATANVNTGISQYAYVQGGTGDAIAVIDNAGSVTVEAVAVASGSVADANADIDFGIYNAAFNTGSGNAAATIANAGAINVNAERERGRNRYGERGCPVFYGIYQSATASTGDASVLISNAVGGSIDVGATAVAAASTVANANATLTSAVYQSADVSSAGDATVAIANDGLINIHANASAIANTAVANASIDTCIEQYAFRGTSGNASATIANGTGATLNIVADAFASGSAVATANATISSYGIYQSATGQGAGNRGFAGIDNQGRSRLQLMLRRLPAAPPTPMRR